MKMRWVGQEMIGALVFALFWAHPAFSQTFTSGSTGSLGPFAPATNMSVVLPADGVLNYTTVMIPAGVTVTFVKNAANTPVTVLATGDVTVAGTINVEGTNALQGQSTGPLLNPGSPGGPGGYRGGNGASRGGSTLPAAGQGPGGGLANINNAAAAGATYGASSGFVSLLPLIGGSGGGGGPAHDVFGTPFSGGSGGGGGGAIVIASSTKITVTGTISANGGAPYGGVSGGPPSSGGGSGGAIRLVAPQVTGTGTLQAIGNGTCPNCFQFGGPGRIRLEAFTQTFSGTVTPPPNLSLSPGPVTAASNPALFNLPTLAITSVGGIAVPAVPGGSFGTADVTVTTNPATVVLTAANTPLNTSFTLKVVPASGNATTFPVSALSGTPASSTATSTVTFPSGQVSVLNVHASLTLTAGLLPLIDGEEVERVLMAATVAGPTITTLITKSGRELPLSTLLVEEQVKAAMALEAMRRSENR
jgi:hypothetical protein